MLSIILINSSTLCTGRSYCLVLNVSSILLCSHVWSESVNDVMVRMNQGVHTPEKEKKRKEKKRKEKKKNETKRNEKNGGKKRFFWPLSTLLGQFLRSWICSPLKKCLSVRSHQLLPRLCWKLVFLASERLRVFSKI